MSDSVMEPKDILLSASDVTMRFGGVTAVSGLSLAVPRGAVTGIIGPNGAGKTTAFNVLSGFYTPQEGSILFDGRDIRGRKPHDICRFGMARTFQNIRLSSQMSVLENIMVGCHVRRRQPWWTAPLGLPSYYREERAIAEKARALAARLGLDDVCDEQAGGLPYGAQRRLEIARALATEPRLLLLDEPAAGMNPQESLELMHLIELIRKEFSLTILLIEHDMKVVMGVCEYIWVMEYGALIAEGTPDEIRSNPAVIRAYLGEDMANA
ncbi:ABC transporter ATP-binding protein [Desulfovibrio sp.]|uniref:ABC transporter ATP-binding protein n=1 Tax=Desulfovibrio sp. TaxID=885 RepID=UPI0025B9588C|nr:ABC transporter ATP-binding protein [Desulfovibrio sp.]MCI7569942.1 ABC transporter ATP-binding protein [Desulfovibrio sp.]